MNDDGSVQYEIAAASQAIEVLLRNGEITKRVFETLSLGLDALTRQDKLARKAP
jgi:hypothetical protein